MYKCILCQSKINNNQNIISSNILLKHVFLLYPPSTLFLLFEVMEFHLLNSTLALHSYIYG